MDRIPLANLNILRPPPPTTEKKSGSAHDCCTFTLRTGSKWICLPLVLLGFFFFMYFLWSYCALKDKTKALPQRNESQVAYYPVSWPPPPPHTHTRNKHTHTICVVHLYKLSKTVFQGKFHFSCLKVWLICLLKIIKLLKFLEHYVHWYFITWLVLNEQTLIKSIYWFFFLKSASTLINK